MRTSSSPDREDRVRDSAITRELNQVGDDQRVNPLLPARESDHTQAKFHAVRVSKLLLLCGWSGTEHTIVPIDTKEQARRRDNGNTVAQPCQNRVDVEFDGIARKAGSAQEFGASGVNVTSVHKRCSAH